MALVEDISVIPGESLKIIEKWANGNVFEEGFVPFDESPWQRN
jgi:hypothetical protein